MHGVAIEAAVPALLEAFPLVKALFMLVETLFALHEGIRIFSKLLAHSRVLLQIALQRWMLLHELLVIHQRGILPQLFGDFRMAVEESIHAGQLPAHHTAAILPLIDLALPLVEAIVALLETLFLLHKGVGIFAELFPHVRMLLQITLQGRVLVNEFAVIYQRGILAKLLRNLGMRVEEAIHTCCLPARHVAIAPVRLLVKA